jgi:glucose-1-phosphate thymidylyltransferase
MEQLVGLIPAAGVARRLSPLPCSKEIFPIGFKDIREEGQWVRRPVPVCYYLFEQLKQGGVEKAFVIINKEKTDILRYIGNGAGVGIAVTFLVQEVQSGMPKALDMAWPWLGDATVMFGMPDTIFSPEHAFSPLLATHKRLKADVTLGLFPTGKPERFGMVAFDKDGLMEYTIDKPAHTDLKFMWGIGCWGPAFSELMHQFLKAPNGDSTEIVLGNVFQSALQAGLRVCVHPFVDGEYIDIGTVSELNLTIQRFSRE